MSNKAAWLTAAKASPLKVDDAPIPTPAANEVIVKNHAVAINPVDWKIQDYGIFVKDYPTVLGEDSAGEIEAVGSAVTNFKKGDRVLAHSNGFASENLATHGSFQLYNATTAKLAAKLPSNISYTQGAVLPLGMSTAAAGLFQQDNLGLPLPQSGSSPKTTGRVVLIWGGSSSVGACAIQLARAAGLEVAATASSHNHDLCKSLGATHVFDHTKKSVVEDVVAGLKGKDFAGVYDTIATADTLPHSTKIASQLGGNKFVSTVLPAGMPLPEGLASDVKIGNVFALTVADNEVGESVWGKWIPAALADGTLQCKPDPLIIGNGLEHVQAGMDKNKQGVSGKKVVIELI